MADEKKSTAKARARKQKDPVMKSVSVVVDALRGLDELQRQQVLKAADVLLGTSSAQ